MTVDVSHFHGCQKCGRRYEDTCKTPADNGRCQTCGLGHPPTVTERNHQPRVCCKTNPRKCTPEVRCRHNLAGPGPWWQCRVCHRTHPFNPATNQPIYLQEAAHG